MLSDGVSNTCHLYKDGCYVKPAHKKKKKKAQILISRIPKRKNNCRSRQSIQLQMHLRPPPTPLLMSHVGFAEGL